MTNEHINPVDIDVLILCGGMGTRLRSVVADRPKSMAQIGQRPFLDILIGQFRQAGFHRFILCTGHMSEAIEAHYRGLPEGVHVVISREPTPLGTAGAVKYAEQHILSDPFLVTNGDSLCQVDLRDFVLAHWAKQAMLSMLVTPATDARDYGSVIVDESRRITGFKEKSDTRTPGCINAGMYLFNKTVLDGIAPGIKSSLEYDIFPKWAGRCFYAFQAQGPVMDIGTPDRLRQANRSCKNT